MRGWRTGRKPMDDGGRHYYSSGISTIVFRNLRPARHRLSPTSSPDTQILNSNQITGIVLFAPVALLLQASPVWPFALGFRFDGPLRLHFSAIAV
jgi:hypothetical protein